ncbi:unnamed protein product [marine sediment metagenome]|uniref:Uncharacterized protein n=1 Tax=marine sediment metagenome TaxID=412755 RepID=X1HE26_9ZZZZ
MILIIKRVDLMEVEQIIKKFVKILSISDEKISFKIDHPNFNLPLREI